MKRTFSENAEWTTLSARFNDLKYILFTFATSMGPTIVSIEQEYHATWDQLRTLEKRLSQEGYSVTQDA